MRLIASLTAVTAVAQFAAAAYDGSGPSGGAPAPADGGYGGPGPSGGGGPGYDGKPPAPSDGYDGPKPKAPVPGGPGYDGKPPAPSDGYDGPKPGGGAPPAPPSGGPGYDGKGPIPSGGYDGPIPKAPVPGGPGYDGKPPAPGDGYDGPKPKAPVPGGPGYDGEKPGPGGGKGNDKPKTGGGAPPAPPSAGPGYDGKGPVPSGGYDGPRPSAPVPVPGGPGYDGKGPVPSGGYDGKSPVPSGGYDGPKPSGAAPVPVPGDGCKGGGYEGCQGGGGGGYDNTNKKTEGCKDGGYEGCQGGGGGGGSGSKSKSTPAPTVVNKATSVPQPQSSTSVYSTPKVYTGASSSKAVVPTSIIKTPVKPSATGYTGGGGGGGGGGGCGGGCGGGSVIPKTEVEDIMKLSESFEFEVRGGLCAISQMPAQAAVVSWRLVYDLDLEMENKFRFEICEPSDQGRVVTKVKDQYVYGVAVSHKETSSGGVELICDNGGLQKVDVGKEKINVVPLPRNTTQEAEGVVYKCSDVSKCKKSSCEADQCRTNLVAKVQGNATASATIDYAFQDCKSKDDCYRVQTCVESKCSGQKPPQGSASAPIPVAQVKASTPGEIVGGSGRTNGSDSGLPKGPTSGSATTIVAVNVLAGAVALAFFL